MDLNFLGQIAPTLYQAVTGNIGGAVKEAMKAFGIETDDKTALEEALKTATPEQIAELKKIDTAYQQRLAELDVDLQKIFADDRASARTMNVQNKDKLVSWLAVSLIVTSFLITLALFFVNIPKDNKDTLFMVLGIVIGYSGNVVTYYFGSSNSSQKKNDTLNNLVGRL